MAQTSDVTERSDADTGKPNLESVVFWNPKLGSETLDGKTQESPATVIEHEFAHDVRIVNDLSGYNKDKRTPDADFENKEEKRDCTGPETKTARANKELKGNNQIRNHSGRWFITTSPISNKKIKYFRK